MWIIIFAGLLIVTALHFVLIRKFGMREGVQVVSNLVTTVATVTLAVFAWQEMQNAKRAEAIQETASWGELRNTMWEILDQFPPSGIETLRTFSLDNKKSWVHNLRKLLDSQIKNSVLIQNKECLGYWRNAISTAKTSFALLSMQNDPEIEELFIKQTTSIMRDVLFVWEKLVLDSDEVSATGGHPEKE